MHVFQYYAHKTPLLSIVFRIGTHRHVCDALYLWCANTTGNTTASLIQSPGVGYIMLRDVTRKLIKSSVESTPASIIPVRKTCRHCIIHYRLGYIRWERIGEKETKERPFISTTIYLKLQIKIEITCTTF
jgi:hypothetical protein